MGRDAIIDEAHEGFRDFASSFEGLSDEKMLQAWFGDWCVRDILAHVAGWHQEMTGVLGRIARGERPVPEGVDYSDADAWNARFAERGRGLSPPDMVRELKASEQAFLEAAGQVPEDRFQEGRAAHRILHATAIDHYKEHAPAIREWRRREGV